MEKVDRTWSILIARRWVVVGGKMDMGHLPDKTESVKSPKITSEKEVHFAPKSRVSASKSAERVAQNNENKKNE